LIAIRSSTSTMPSPLWSPHSQASPIPLPSRSSCSGSEITGHRSRESGTASPSRSGAFVFASVAEKTGPPALLWAVSVTLPRAAYWLASVKIDRKRSSAGGATCSGACSNVSRSPLP
jgi:hypothetical protein